jgi:3-oxoacyl-[acyl-carrier protein] reductase
MINLKDKVSLVTGASRGIGRATALMLARAGSHLLVHFNRDEEAAAEVTRLAQEAGVKALPFAAEISDRTQVREMVALALRELGRIDLLVNNAGIWETAAIQEMTEEQLRRTLDTNLSGVFHACSAVAPPMIAQKSGNIVNISSTAGQRGEAFYSHYAASKGAVIALTKSLAPELAPHGIRVNCVAPGWVVTDMSQATLTGPRAKEVLEKIPLGRAGTPEEIAGCVLFLASDQAGFVTGEILNANGGAVLCG